MLYLADEVIEVMHQNDSLDTFPSETESVERGEEMLDVQAFLLNNGFAEWYVKEEKHAGRIIEAGCYRLTKKARTYLKQKRKAGLNKFNYKALSQKERGYVKSRIDLDLTCNSTEK